jgi:dTDP-3-amino-2,3,6-trideoxy-4-keto-D-glucose/dTDP-3-amino-3,4,6-trideoxy-alpha-D-glucose/dTDP-2,6-dideoxy-D-kanosamine transaminase
MALPDQHEIFQLHPRMTSHVPLNDLVRQNRLLHEELASAARRVVERGWYVLGSECTEFEREFARYCGSADCIGVANGTDAIELALRAVGVAPGDRVATVANAGFYSSTAIHAIGAAPVYVDVDETQGMSVASLRQAVAGQGVGAVIVTHLYGRLADVEEVVALCKPLGIPVLEDCAQAHGASRGGRKAGSFGTLGCFSFYPTKNLGALGDGGAITTDDAALAAQLRELRQYGWDSKYRVGRTGGRNSRLDEMQAAMLRIKLPHLDRWNEERRSLARRYAREIQNPRVRCPNDFGPDNVAHLFVVCCEDRDGFRGHLDGHGVSSDIHYPIPDHRQPGYGGTVHAGLSETERLAGQIVTIPCFAELAEDEIRQVIQAVNSW